MTPVSQSPVTRRCLDIVNAAGKPLDASLTPDEGGTLTLRWVGSRKGSAGEYSFSLRDLVAYGDAQASQESEPAEAPTTPAAGGDIPLSRLASKIHTTPMDVNDRARLLSILRDMELHDLWMKDPSGVEWEEFKAQHK